MSSGGIRFTGTLLVAVDKTQIGADLILPSVCKEVLSVTPWMAPTDNTADKMYITQLELESSDVDLNPTKIAVYMQSAEDAAVTVGAATMIYPTYDLNVPVNGGDVIQAFGTNLSDPTADAELGCHLLVSDVPSGRQQIFYTNPAAMNAYGAGTGAYVAGATYRANNMSRIVRTYACAGVNGTRAVDTNIGGSFKLESPDFKTNLPQVYGYQPCIDNSTTLGNGKCSTVKLWKTNIPTDPTVAITEYLDNEAIASTPGVSWISGIGYHKTNRRR